MTYRMPIKLTNAAGFNVTATISSALKVEGRYYCFPRIRRLQFFRRERYGDGYEQRWNQEDSCWHHRRQPGSRMGGAGTHSCFEVAFEITALSTTRRESAETASKLFGVPIAFDNHKDLVNSALVDVVAVTVKVPYHLELATAALDAGKAVYCEWPLGNGLKEAQTLAALANKKGVLAVAGLQARSAPSAAYVHDLIKQGYVGEVLSTTLIGSGMGWGPTVEPYNAYLNEKKNGATMLSIALGHAADALCHCLGEVRELSATMTVRRKSFTIAGTGESKPMTADDQVLVSGLLEGGAALSIHYRGGVSRGTNLLWELNGTEGDLQLTAAGGQAQLF